MGNKLGNPLHILSELPQPCLSMCRGCGHAMHNSLGQGKARRCSTGWVMWNLGLGPNEAMGKEGAT